jgi:ABC-type Na+ efflux pump permease subunit
MNALFIGWNGLARVMREPRALFWIFFGPLLATVFFGLLFRPQTARPPSLAILNHDATDSIASHLMTTLSAEHIAVEKADRLVPERLTLVIPPGASQQVAAGQGIKLVLHARDDETSVERSIRFDIQKAMVALMLRGFRAESAASDPSPALPDGPLVIVQKDIGVRPRPIPAGFQRSVPAYLVMFLFMNLLTSGAGIAEERATGVMKRLTMTPVGRIQILFGKLLSRFALGWIQIVYMLLIGAVAGIQWAEHPFVLFGFLTIVALACASTGILIGTLFDDPDKCINLAVWTTIVLSPLGGLWWPIEVVGPTMRRIAYFVPTGWAMEGVNALLAFGAGAGEVAPFALAFALMFAATFSLAARRL